MSPRWNSAPVVAALAVTVTVLAGCGTDPSVRNTSRITAGHLDSLQRDYLRYLQRVDEDAARRIVRIAEQRQRLAVSEHRLDANLDQWAGAAGGSQQRALYDALLRDAAEQIKTERELASRAEVERKVLADALKKIDREAVTSLSTISEQLTALAAPVSRKRQLRFLREYFQAVGQEVRALDAKARESGEKADGPAAEKTK